jgi:tetratricopeptide (TPR) repeat protein
MARESITKLANAQKTLLENKEPYWANQVDLQRQIVSAWLAFAEGKGDEALKMMRAAADAEDVTDKHPVTPGSILPARELLGEVLLELKRPADALPEFETVLKAAPARFNAIYGAGRAAQLAGNDAKARDYFAKLVQLGRDADSERAELTAAKNFLATNAKTGASRE